MPDPVAPTEAIAMPSILLILALTVLLSACSSSGDLIRGSEDYTGLQIAAVAPVSDRRPGRGPSDQQLHANIQRSIQRQLDRSGIFAGVVALDRADEGNEAEVIIEPALVAPGGYGGNDVDLRVRVTEKTRRRVVLDARYEGNGRTNPLKLAIKELENDLEDRYDK